MMVNHSSSSVMDKIIANTIEAQFDDVDKETLQNAKDRILDTIGCLIGGASDPSNPELVDLIMDYGGKQEATILMYGSKVPVSNAAMVNCILCRSFDYEPVSPVVENKMAAGHVSGTTVMTALSLSESAGASGRELITAMLIGDDLAARLLNTSEFTLSLGWDGNGTANGLAATAIAGRLLGLDEYQLRNAFGLALNQLSGSAQNIWEGNTAFKLPIGLVARNAIFSAQLARAGWTAPIDPLLGTFGYYDLFTTGFRNEELLTKDLGKKFWGDRTFKPYPCCRGNHSVIDCALEIVNSNPINADEIDHVFLCMSEGGQKNFCGQPWEIGDFPHGNAIFSYQFTVATALLKKAVKPEHFTEEAIREPKTNEFINRISYEHLPDGHGVSVKVIMKDGRKYTADSQVARGDIASNPISRDELIGKFRENIAFANKHTKKNAEKLLNLLENIEYLDNINEIIHLLVP